MVQKITIDAASTAATKVVYLIEDDNSYRESIKLYLGLENYQVYSYANPSEFFKQDLVSNAVIILDMCLPEILGIDVQAQLKRLNCKLPIIFISAESNPQQIISAMRMGVVDFLLKPFNPEVLITAISNGFDRLARDVEEERKRNFCKEAIKKLSPREIEIFDLITKGYSNGEIADEMKIVMSTVKEYKANVHRKLGVNSLAKLIEIKSYTK